MPWSARTLRHAAGLTLDHSRHAFGQVFPQSPARLASDASAYWTGRMDRHLRDDAHWRDGSKFAGTGLWEETGLRHLELYRRLRAASAAEPVEVKTVTEWGCGGGANAVAFAGIAGHVTGVDVSPGSLDECAQQMASLAPDVPFTPVLASVRHPEEAAAGMSPCELFLCLYVLELVPDQAYGLRLMRIARGLLVPGGQAFVQVKYSTGSWRTRTRRRGYRTAVAGVTYRVDQFWEAAAGIGFRPEAVALVPRNELDEHYAYFLLSRA